MRQTRNLLGVEWLLVGSNPTLSVVRAKFKRIDLKRELFKSKSEGAIFSAYWQLLLTIIRWFASGITQKFKSQKIFNLKKFRKI